MCTVDMFAGTIVKISVVNSYVYIIQVLHGRREGFEAREVSGSIIFVMR